MSSFIIIGYLIICATIIQTTKSNPVDSVGKINFREEANLNAILTKIESRLKNLDSLYINQLTPTLEGRLEHFQNRISGMEIKLLRIETLLTTKLDRMSDNISSRHFRDDMVQTDMFRKIETAYDGITHRLTYMDRKSDINLSKLMGKIDGVSKQKNLENSGNQELTSPRDPDHFEKLLNEYAAKVSDLGAQVLKVDEKLGQDLNKLEKHMNSSKIETQNAFRTLMVQMGKITPKEREKNNGVLDLNNIETKLDKNFKKIISTQNDFMESCHRLQMDESQLENQISDILNKLIDSFALTSKEQHQLLKKIEGNLIRHDMNQKKGMHQVNTNILITSVENKKISDDVKQNLTELFTQKSSKIEENLEKLFGTMQEFARNQTKLFEKMKNPWTKLEIIGNSSERIVENFTGITTKISETLQILNENNDNLRKILQVNLPPKNETDTNGNATDLDEIIRTVFSLNNTNATNKKPENNCSDLKIDVRYDGERNNCTNDTIVYPENEQEENNCTGINLDVRFTENGKVSNKCKNSTNTEMSEPTDASQTDEPSTESLNFTEFLQSIFQQQENLTNIKNSTEYIDLDQVLN